MTYNTAEARQQLLDEVAEAVQAISMSLAAIGGAYERLDEDSADRLEDALFRPVQLAYGRARRTHTEFAARHGLPERRFEPAAVANPAHSVPSLIEDAVDAIERAEMVLSELQDSMMPVEVGDPELRAGLADVRERIGGVTGAAQQFMRSFGR